MIPAFLLAHLFCVCGGAVAAVSHNVHAVTSMADSDACCDHAPASHSNLDHKTAPAPVGSHQHNPDCDHCTGSANLTAPEAAMQVIPVDFASFTLFAPLLIDHSVLGASARFQSVSRWLVDPSPPPDLLRVKCSLQI